MLELLYIGRFDYLARSSIHAPTRVPNDADIETALRDLQSSEQEREDKCYAVVEEMACKARN